MMTFLLLLEKDHCLIIKTLRHLTILSGFKSCQLISLNFWELFCKTSSSRIQKKYVYIYNTGPSSNGLERQNLHSRLKRAIINCRSTWLIWRIGNLDSFLVRFRRADRIKGWASNIFPLASTNVTRFTWRCCAQHRHLLDVDYEGIGYLEV